MNYEESLARLKDRKEWLENNKARKVDIIEHWGGPVIRTELRWNDEKDKDEWNLVKSVLESYSQSFSGEINDDKINEAFSEVQGFIKQKEEVKSYLLLRKYFKEKKIKFSEKGKILCFTGPPGIGKTHFASKFAKACGRKFFSIEVGGESDPQLINGVDRTFVESHVGKIITAIQETKSCDPVILIDEIEKSGESKRGSLKDALLHVLDPEHNKKFTDRYLDIPIDISKITFILTANDLEKIPDPLKHRLEVIKLKGYSESEKVEIAKMLIKKFFQEDYDNANKDLFEMREEVIRTLISKKTKEEGVRQLKRGIEDIIRWCFFQWAKQHEKGEEETKIIIDENKVNEIIPEETDKEDDENTKLRKKIEELEQENEDLKKKTFNLQLFKSLVISEDKEHCNKCKKITLQTSKKTCSLCEIVEQVKQLEAIITQENYQTCEKIWQEQKSEWEKINDELKNGSEEEKKLSQQIKNSIEKIDKKFQQVRHNNNANSQQNKDSTSFPWIIGGGVMLTLVGCFFGWLLTKKNRKKKNINYRYDKKK